jgi:hypothetical protein
MNPSLAHGHVHDPADACENSSVEQMENDVFLPGTTSPRGLRERPVVFSTGQRVAVVLLVLSLVLVSGLTQLGVRRSSRDTSFEGLAYGLRGRKVVMIGDSLMRYKYLTLVAFLETGVKLSTLPGANETTPGSNNRVVENTWDSWHDFYTVTTYRPKETCDCWRAERGAANPGPASIKENRRYLSQGYDISYYQLLEVAGSCVFRGHTEGSNHTSPVATPYDWCFSLKGFMDFIALSVKPDLLLLNTGLWGKMEPSAIRSILDAVPRIKQTVWFRTTNTRANDTASTFDDPLTKHFVNHSNVAVANTWSVSTNLLAQLPPEQVYWDKLHFFAFAYEFMLRDALQQAL